MATLQGEPFFFVKEQLVRALADYEAQNAGVLDSLQGSETEINKRWAWSAVGLKNGEFLVAASAPAVVREGLPAAIKLLRAVRT